jgi:hypothetical protein
MKARNMKLLLYMFEQMFGLKNNFEKSEVVLVERDGIIVVSYADISNCQIGSFPLKYLGYHCLLTCFIWLTGSDGRKKWKRSWTYGRGTLYLVEAELF